MISIYLASVDFHLTRLLWSKVSSYSTNPLTRDKETETTSILLVTSSDLMIVLSSSGGGPGVGGPMGVGLAPSEERGSGGRGAERRAPRLAAAQLQCLAWGPLLCTPQSPALVPGQTLDVVWAQVPALLRYKSSLAVAACSLWHISHGYF